MKGRDDFGSYFDICETHHGGNADSIAANIDVSPRKYAQRSKIKAYLADYPACCDEAEAALGMSHQACSARFSELKASGDIVPVFRESGEPLKRLTRNGSKAQVFRLRDEEAIK